MHGLTPIQAPVASIVARHNRARPAASDCQAKSMNTGLDLCDTPLFRGSGFYGPWPKVGRLLIASAGNVLVSPTLDRVLILFLKLL
jgi:hypothetical protein